MPTHRFRSLERQVFQPLRQEHLYLTLPLLLQQQVVPTATYLPFEFCCISRFGEYSNRWLLAAALIFTKVELGNR